MSCAKMKRHRILHTSANSLLPNVRLCPDGSVKVSNIKNQLDQQRMKGMTSFLKYTFGVIRQNYIIKIKRRTSLHTSTNSLLPIVHS